MPEFRRVDSAVIAEAAVRLAQGCIIAVVKDDFERLPRYRNKCFGLACETLIASGLTSTDFAKMGQLAAWIRPDDAYAEGAALAFAVKYTTRGDGLA